MRGRKPENTKPADAKKKRILLNILMILCVGVFTGAVGTLAWTLWNSRQEDNSFRKLAGIIQTEAQRKEYGLENGTHGENKEGAEELEQVSDYAGVYALNHDFAAWIRINGTVLDYPVMCSPYDPQYYIRRDFYGRNSISGTPFLGEGCNVESLSVIVYGHNMKNGTMFGTLDKYSKADYWREHPMISFDTLKEERQYDVFSVFQTRLYQEEGDSFPYYEYGGDISKEEYESFVAQAREKSLYDTGIVPEYGEELLILSTCSYQADDGRFVVAARRRNLRQN